MSFGNRQALSLLVVEKEERVASVIRTIFERSGHTVTLAGTLGAARSLIEHVAPDAIVIDFVLADGNGLAFARQVRAERNIGVVLMSGGLAELPDSDDVQMLAKPFTPDQLEDSLQRCLAGLAV